MKRLTLVIYVTLLTAAISCKKPYNPPAVSSNANYLVVDGVINNGPDSTFIKLSRTVPLSATSTLNPELNATVTVEGDENSVFPLTAKGAGVYAMPGVTLNAAHKYRLRIKTAGGSEYLSDYVAVLDAPAIDSVGYTANANGVNIVSNSRAINSPVKYYRWDYIETYIFHSNYYSFYKSNGDTVDFRDMDNDNVYWCFRSDSASSVNIGTTAKLSANVIENNPIASVSATSEKFTEKYSILVRQFALTPEAYSFWDNLRKNTEQLGSIFDAQPTSLQGNIHNTAKPSEPVIGYLSVGAITTRRIFITKAQLPASYLPEQHYSDCVLDSLYFKYYTPQGQGPINQENEFFNINKGAQFIQIPIAAIHPAMSPLLGHTGSTPACVDCTLRGTNKQPAFWK